MTKSSNVLKTYSITKHKTKTKTRLKQDEFSVMSDELKLIHRKTSNSPTLVKISSEPIRNQDFARRRTTAPDEETKTRYCHDNYNHCLLILTL